MPPKRPFTNPKAVDNGANNFLTANTPTIVATRAPIAIVQPPNEQKSSLIPPINPFSPNASQTLPNFSIAPIRVSFIFFHISLSRNATRANSIPAIRVPFNNAMAPLPTDLSLSKPCCFKSKIPPAIFPRRPPCFFWRAACSASISFFAAGLVALASLSLISCNLIL